LVYYFTDTGKDGGCRGYEGGSLPAGATGQKTWVWSDSRTVQSN